MDMLLYATQAIALLKFRNYYLYAGMLVFRSIAFNLIIWFITRRRFSGIRPVGRITRQERDLILRKTGALVGHKVGTVVVNSVDNILISAYIGLNVVAVYNNYFYILTALSGLFLMLTNGLTSIIGNYIIKKDQPEIVGLFHDMHFFIALGVCFCCTCLLNMYQPFISVWTGEDSLLPFSSVILFTVYFYIVKIKTTGLLFKDAAGLWEKDALKPYIQIVIDLTIDLALLRTIGINGAIISSIACILFGFFYEAVVVFKYCLKESPKGYYLKTGLYGVATAVSCIASMSLCWMCPIYNGVVTMLLNCAISSSVSILVFLLCTHRTKEFSHGMRFIKANIWGECQ